MKPAKKIKKNIEDIKPNEELKLNIKLMELYRVKYKYHKKVVEELKKCQDKN